MPVKPGIEVLLEKKGKCLDGAVVGAVIHPASVSGDMRHTVDGLMKTGRFRLVALFGPQHGARGEQQDNMMESGFYRDPHTHLPVYSLYGDTRRPTEEMMSDIDALIFDLQDVGTRVYTFISTMAYCMEACARWGKRMVVLDRPNPINGLQVEGNTLDMNRRSFVGLYPIPMRHGMTMGELALFFNSEFDIGCDVTVVEMEGWEREHWHDQTGLPWIMPSPNLPTLDSAAVYPGSVLIEGTCLSEGRGTTRPFELIGAPFVDGRRYAGEMNARKLPGVFFRPVEFLPTFQKWAGETCGGVQVHVLDRERFEPYFTGIALMSAARALYPESFTWRQPPYEYEYEKLPIELLCGNAAIPEMVWNGIPPETIRQSWQAEQESFLRRRSRFLLY
ncbi:MAG TPA: DUF1343 domain-containing protein [Acidobacteriota bacterium]|nr:DUF1343 domain-containing protein [Acidobacteriota bacterium]